MIEDLTVVVVVWGSYVRWLPELHGRLIEEDVSEDQLLVCTNADPAAERAATEIWPEASHLALPARVSIGAARNAALNHVGTRKVCFCDADDLPAPGALRKLMAACDRQPGPVLATGLAARVSEGKVFPYAWPPAWAAQETSRLGRVVRQWGFNHLSVTTGAVLDVAAVRRLGGFPDESLAEDGMLACALAAAGPVVVLDQVTREYRTHEDGLCQRGLSATEWANAYRVQRRWLAGNRSLPGWRILAHLYAPVHLWLARRLARVVRHDV